MNKVKMHREENGEAICYVQENGKWKRYNNSTIWQTNVRLKKEGKEVYLGFAGDNGFRCFQLALKAGYELVPLKNAMINVSLDNVE